MKKLIIIIVVGFITVHISSCDQSHTANEQTTSATNNELADYINSIKAVDNHAHPTTIDPNDKGYDALPLESILPFEIPARIRPDGPQWLAAAKAVYGFTGSELNENAMTVLADTAANVMKQQGEKFPGWALDKAGIEVMLGNRITMGPGGGLTSPRFRWVSYVDALLFPLSTKAEAAVSSDRKNLFPLEDSLLKKYLTDLNITKLPATLDQYLKQVITPTLEAQKKGGCLALKYEAAYLRSLDFEKTTLQSASEVYAKNINGGEPPNEKYKLLQDHIFYYIAKEAGRLGMAIHIHSFPGAGNYFIAQGCDPLLLEPVFNDPELRDTKFVLIHGGGTFYQHTSAMLWKPNVYADISLLTFVWTPDQLAAVLKDWLSQFPEKIIFGTDASNFGPGLDWGMSAWIASTTGRKALTIALTEMINSNEITVSRAKEIATMVLRTNANNLYNLGLK
jgi:hypothetical protein